LDDIIKKHKLIGISTVIPLAMFRETVSRPEIKKRFNPDPFSAAMQGLIRDAVMCVRNYAGENNLISFVCDDGPSSAHLLSAYQDFKRKNQWLARMMKGLAPQDDKLTPQLQAADLVANMSKELASEYLKTRTKVALKRLEGSFYKMSVWKPETVVQIAEWQHER